MGERASLLNETAPLLKALWQVDSPSHVHVCVHMHVHVHVRLPTPGCAWQADLLGEELLLLWAAGTTSSSRPTEDDSLRRFAAPLVEWLQAVDPEIP